MNCSKASAAHKIRKDKIMKIFRNCNLIIAACAGLILLNSTAYAQPPDNAALLYYQAFLLYEKPDDTMEQMLSDFRDGKIIPNELIERYIEKNRQVIDLVIKASYITNCDWGYDYSQSFDLILPHIAQFRKISFLIPTEAKLLAEQGDYKSGLSRCLTAYKVALHAANKPEIISYIVAIGLNALANKSMQDILAYLPEDTEELNSLKNKLLQVEGEFPSLVDCLDFKSDLVASITRKDRADLIAKVALEGFDEPRQDLAERVLKADEEFFAGNRIKWQESMTAIKETIESEMPYPQTCAKLDELLKEFAQGADKDPDKTINSIFLPAIDTKVYSLSVRRKNHLNAIQAAIEIYIKKADTGKLPDELPEDLPKDLFSGKDFKYDKTSGGFVLKCRGKDLSRDETYEYEFKVKK
jgi:hypothetical protein